jgi:hypothetical protein
MAFQWNQEKVNSANEAQQSSGFSPIPAGTIARVMIVKCEDKSTQAGGNQLVFEFDVIEGPYKGRKIWDRHNYNCPSSTKAEEIAWRAIGELTEACWPGQKKQAQLHEYEGKVLVVKTKLGKEYNGNVPTEIAKYMADGAAATTKSAPAVNPSDDDLPF